MPSPSMQRAELEMGVAPPNQAPIVETVSTDEYRPVPATNLNNPAAGAKDVGRPPVADVTLDYDPNFKKLLAAVNDPTPESKLKVVDQVNKRINEGQKEHFNERFDPGAFFVAFLRGRVDDMYTAYNGGRKYAEVGSDVLDNRYAVIKNQRGFAGRVENAENRELTPEELKKVNTELGGILTASDRSALQSANWQTAQEAIKAVRNGDTSELNATRAAAFAAANEGKSQNPLIGEEIYLAGKLKPVLGYISTLDPKQRQLLLGYAQRYQNASAGLQKAGEKSGSTSLGNQQQIGGGFGPVGGQPGPNGAVPPSANVNASLGGTQGTRQEERNSENQNRDRSIQEMQDTQRAIMMQLQGVIKTPEQFQDFMKLTALNQSNNQALGKVPPDVIPDGFRQVAPVDLFMSGADNIIEQRYAQQTNNALMAAYYADLYKAQRDGLKTGKTIAPEEVRKNFGNSEIAKALLNYGQERIHTFTGKGEPLKKGAKIYNPNTGKLDTYGE